MTAAPFDLDRYPIAAAALGLNPYARDAFAARMAGMRQHVTPEAAQGCARHLKARRLA